jgi:hypothetical protein
LRLLPNKPRDLTNRSSEPSLENTMVRPYGVNNFYMGEQGLQFGGHIHVVNPSSTLACVLDRQTPSVSCNGLNVTETCRFKDLEGRYIMFFEVEITSNYPQPCGVQATWVATALKS